MPSNFLAIVALVFGATLLVSLGLTPLVRRVALQRGLLDVPGEARRVHKVAVPRLGGLAMYAAFAAGVLVMFAAGVQNRHMSESGNGRFEPSRILFFLLGAGIITVVMAVDDIRGIRPLPRLIWQIGAALLVIVPGLLWPGGPNVQSNGQIEAAGTLHFDQGAGVIATSVQSPLGGVAINLPIILAVLFTTFWIVGMTNTINWIDGLDGLAAGVTVVACGVLFLLTVLLKQYTLAYLPLILGAATLGFLPYNVHPARIFMGDSGAMFLGFSLAVISIIGGAKLAAALLVLGIPIFDGIYMMIYRIYRGRSPMSSDRGHLHHRLLDIGLSQQQVVMIFYLLSATFGIIELLLPTSQLEIFGVSLSSGSFRLFALAVLVVVMIALMIYITRRSFDRVSAGGSGAPATGEGDKGIVGTTKP